MQNWQAQPWGGARIGKRENYKHVNLYHIKKQSDPSFVVTALFLVGLGLLKHIHQNNEITIFILKSDPVQLEVCCKWIATGKELFPIILCLCIEQNLPKPIIV